MNTKLEVNSHLQNIKLTLGLRLSSDTRTIRCGTLFFEFFSGCFFGDSRMTLCLVELFENLFRIHDICIFELSFHNSFHKFLFKIIFNFAAHNFVYIIFWKIYKILRRNRRFQFFSVILTFALRTNEGYRVDTVTDAAEFPFADNFSILQRLVSHSRPVTV